MNMQGICEESVRGAQIAGMGADHAKLRSPVDAAFLNDLVCEIIHRLSRRILPLFMLLFCEKFHKVSPIYYGDVRTSPGHVAF